MLISGLKGLRAFKLIFPYCSLVFAQTHDQTRDILSYSKFTLSILKLTRFIRRVHNKTS